MQSGLWRMRPLTATLPLSLPKLDSRSTVGSEVPGACHGLISISWKSICTEKIWFTIVQSSQGYPTQNCVHSQPWLLRAVDPSDAVRAMAVEFWLFFSISQGESYAEQEKQVTRWRISYQVPKVPQAGDIWSMKRRVAVLESWNFVIKHSFFRKFWHESRFSTGLLALVVMRFWLCSGASNGLSACATVRQWQQGLGLLDQLERQ